jgi:apolipoprotein N-acyltransferase
MSSEKINALIINEETFHRNIWGYKSLQQGMIALGLTCLSIGFQFMLSIGYPDTFGGPLWLVSFMAFSPLIVGCLLYRNSITQMYGMTLIAFGISFGLISIGLGKSFIIGVGGGLLLYVPLALCLHLWSFVFPKMEDISIGWTVRVSAVFVVFYYIIGLLFGHMTSIAIQFFRTPFMLQPISVFGFGSLEILVLFTNSVLAWWVFAGIEHRKFIPVSKGNLLKNPLVYWIVLLAVWIVIAGIITGTHKSTGRIKVATVGGVSRIPEITKDASKLADVIAEKIRSTHARFVVAPEAVLRSNLPVYGIGGSPSCEEAIAHYIAPKVKGLGAYVVIGCAEQMNPAVNNGCLMTNMAYTLDPEGKIIGKYAKRKASLGEKICGETGTVVMEAEYNAGSNQQTGSASLSTESVNKLKFATVICNDASFSSPVADAADKGAVLILDPANDWYEIRHSYAVTVLRAVENRVALVKAEKMYDPVIVDAFGHVVAKFDGPFQAQSPASDLIKVPVDLAAEVVVSEPLKANWLRQQALYWILIVALVCFLTLDIIYVVKKRRQAPGGN